LFRQIGFFHFVQDSNRPIEALRQNLATADVAEALLVLPEAFNYGRLYRSGGGYLHDAVSIAGDLRKVAAEFSVTFVVSLLCPGTGASIDNTAFLIGKDDFRPICKKTRNDGTNNYKPCENACDIENPAIFADFAIGVLICMDVDDHKRCRAIVRATEASAPPQKFICIPAAMCNSAYFGGGRLGSSIPLQRPSAENTQLIFANSDPSGPGSFITDGSGTVVKAIPVDQRDRNQIMTLAPEVASRQPRKPKP
jgi:hypothetical protein